MSAIISPRSGAMGTRYLHSSEFFPDPFADYASTAMPENMYSMLRWCLVPGTPIELGDFSIVPIEDVTTGMTVLTRGRTVEKVIAIGSRPVDEDIVELCFAGLGEKTPLRLTSNHQVWRIKTTKLRPGKVRPRIEDSEKVPAADVIAGDYVATPLPVRPPQKPPRFSGYIFGMYLAEASAFGNKGIYQGVRFVCGADDEVNGVIARFRSCLEWSLGEIAPETYTPPSRPDVRVLSVYDVELPDWLVEHGGKYAKHKKLSAAVLAFDDDTLLDMIGGWLDGDGWLCGRPGRFEGTAGQTSSFSLAYQLQRVAHCLGLAPSLCRVKNDRGKGVPDGLAYVLKFGKGDCERLVAHSAKLAWARDNRGDFATKQAQPRSVFVKDGYVYRKIKKATKVRYTGPVHNFEVENDHSYVAGGVIVANCEFVFMRNGIYREALRRKIAYFITDLEVSGDDISREEKTKRKDFYENKIDIKSDINVAATNYACFHRDTPVVARDGVYRIGDLAGKTVDILSQGSTYRPATFRSHGRQPLLEVEFSDGRKLLATPEHEWVAYNCSGKAVRVPTTRLRRRYRIERTVAPRPEKDDEFYEGVRHGFTFGDGTCYNGGKQVRANFYGAKDLAMLPYFEGRGSAPIPVQGRDAMQVHGLPSWYKLLPDPCQGANYWYGFVCGFLAADGSVDTYGCAVLTQACEETLEIITAQLPRIGMAAGPVRGYDRVADLSAYNGNEDAIYEGPMYYATLLKRFVQADDLLLPEHRAKFLEHYSETDYGRCIAVEAVRETGIVDEVFCCVEPETHTFVVGQAILTGNCYGNDFASLHVPFRRYLSCPKCFSQEPLHVVYNAKDVFDFHWTDYEFVATCPRCAVGAGYRGVFNHVDLRGDEEADVSVVHWDPHQIEIVYDLFSHKKAYVWKIPADYKEDVRRGTLITLENAPWEMVQAVKNDNAFMFAPDVIYHMMDETLAGIRNRGWGISQVITNFSQAWYVQVLHRYNEAIAYDYVIPFRVITPAPRGGAADAASQDPVVGMNLGHFVSRVKAMLRNRKRDPAAWNVMPFPVEYQALGGEAAQLAPKDLLDQGIDNLLSAAGIPPSMYKMDLTAANAPPALRLFEIINAPLVHNLNGYLRWLDRKITARFSWEPADTRWRRVTYADDAQKQMAQLQLMMGRQISQTTGLQSVGLNFEGEQKAMLEEEKFVAEESQKMQEEMAETQPPPQAAPGDAAQGGAAPGGAAPGGSDPPELLAKASQIAQQIASMSDSQRTSELINLKKTDPTLHSLVKSQLEDIQQDAERQGGQQVMARQYGKQGSFPFSGLMLHVPERQGRVVELD